MFEKVGEADFIRGEHQILKFWSENAIFEKLRRKNAGMPKWSFLDGPITANNPMGVHHAWGRAYKDAFQRYFAMTGRELRYQNGFDCQGLWVEVEVEKELNLGTKNAIHEFGIDRFVNECKKRVLRFAARQTEQSIRLGYWMEWDDPATLRLLAEKIGTDEIVKIKPPALDEEVPGRAHELVAKLGNPEWGGSYFTFSTENNETIWTFLKKCFTRGKVYRGYDVMPWSGRGGSAYSQMEVADGRRLTVHKSCFVRFPLKGRGSRVEGREPEFSQADDSSSDHSPLTTHHSPEFLLVWTTTPWTLTSNVACAVNPDLDYVKLRTKRDGAVYYFAKENLDYQRLAAEFKDGFGRPEWKWPAGVPKLKTIAQIFKEQGGYEIEETLKGAEMVGWQYEGPFDDLVAQQQPGGWTAIEEGAGYGFGEYGYGVADGSGYGDPEEAMRNRAVAQHRVIDGGRDSKGNPHVVAGEGTGIVHIAPGCGDVDHQLGAEHGLVGIAPLAEDGRFEEGFGDFTGREAIDPETAELVFDKLREKHMLVTVEQYPHVYPHCWRTGDELVFRLVDEWFINMDWRDEIKQVVTQITWLPPEIQGQERELEWLTNMRDWMISKKRFWGLALPIWFDEQTGDFEVIGSLAELKERAALGWDDFEGNTPHRPWIDNVKIRNPKTGNLMTRIVDVGNPWLDAGIVAFSTMPKDGPRPMVEGPGPESVARNSFGLQPAQGSGPEGEGESAIHHPQSAIGDSGPRLSTLDSRPSPWFPADLVLECFPGQFRNWFYSLLSMSTMMRYDETEDPREKRPFKTLFGHRLVMDEQGRPMHKSDGTAIWFEEAAEQLGVDTMRWMYLAQNPAIDLRFGTRHPDQPVTLETPEGAVTHTKEGLPTAKVTSKPSDEIRRQILIPLWNSYAFLVNYARLDEFDPSTEAVPIADRPEIDRWILSNLQALIQNCREAFENYDAARACQSAANFIDDLSNWYIRRNRRRFWRSKDASDTDKLAAYQTLHEVLLTLTKLLAPVIPFLAERMYQNLAVAGETSPESVHLCGYPQPRAQLLDPELNERMATAQLVVKLGHRLREEAKIRVRQPLETLRFAADSPEQAAAIRSMADVIQDELNVKQLTPSDNLDDLVRYSYKPNLKTLGPKYGKLLGPLRKELPEMDPAVLAPLRSGRSVTVSVGGTEVTLEPDDVLVSTEQAADWVCADDRGIQIALSTALTPELIKEGIARDFVRHVQQKRKEADLEIQDRINIYYACDDAEVNTALAEWADYIRGETLADSLAQSSEIPPNTKPVTVGDVKIVIWIETGGRGSCRAANG